MIPENIQSGSAAPPMHTTTARRLRFLPVAAVMTAATLAVAACSGGGSGTKTSSVGSTGSGGNAAAGSSVVVGFINQTTGTQAAYPEMTVAAKAAVAYVNSELGGAGGHKIDLRTCDTDGTPAKSQSCAQEIASKKPLVVLEGSDFNWPLAAKIFRDAHIPVFGQTPVVGADYTAKDTFYQSSGSLGAGAGQVAYILKTKPDVKKVGVIGPQIAPLKPLLDIMSKALQQHGVTVSSVLFPPTTTDFLGAWSALKANNLDYVIAEVPTPYCAGLINASKSQSNKTPVVTTALCNSKEIFGKVGTAMDGWSVNGTGPDPYGDSADAKTYQAKMAKYAPSGANLGGYAPFGFGLVMWVTQNIMKPIGDNLTVDSLRAQAEKPGGHMFLGADSYQCGTSSEFPAVCSWQVYMTRVKGAAIDTSPGSAQWVDSLETLKAGTS